jgi:hypothetical protein
MDIQGVFGVAVKVDGHPPVFYSLTVRDTTRLAQDVDAELGETGTLFAEPPRTPAPLVT